MNIPNMEGVVAECKLTITPASKFTLENVFFDSGKATLKPESFIELDELVKYMMQKKSTVIEVSGHTDDVGNIEANLKLFNDRANSVKAYLIKKGIDATRVEAKGYGDTIPVTDNTTGEVKKKNRRTEVKIVTR